MKKYRVGVVTGKFLPPHVGHVELIEHARSLCDVLYVVLAERRAQSGDGWLHDGRVRLQWMRDYWADSEDTKFLYMDHGDLPPRPSGTQQWCKRLKDLVGVKIDARIFGCEDYFQMDAFFPGCESVWVQRGVDSVDISATRIRANIADFLGFVIPTAKIVD